MAEAQSSSSTTHVASTAFIASYNDIVDNSNTNTNPFCDKNKKQPCLLGCKYNNNEDATGDGDGERNNNTTTTLYAADGLGGCELTVAEIKKKMTRMRNNNNNTKSNCFWCTCEFDNEACHIPKCEVDGTIECYGIFCRAECAAGFLMGEFIDDSSKMERYNLLNDVYGKIFRYVRAIKPAPAPFYLLDKFCGNLSIQEYRKILKSDSIVTVIEKPMTRVFPELHEDNEEFTTNVFRKKPLPALLTSSSSSSSRLQMQQPPPPPPTQNSSLPTTTFKVKRQSKKVKEVNKNSILHEAFFP